VSDIEQNILKELRREKKLIKNPDIPIKSYNYSYIRDLLRSQYRQKVSLPTIIKRAKKNDSSYHRWAPLAENKWHLITSLDDYSRTLLYADFVERETSWDHISALESVILRFGLPYAYYTDSHSIFRFVQGRDSFWRTHYKLTDDVDTQFKQVLQECHIQLNYALSPQAKGKVERPYGWLQDRIVRTCARENIKNISPAREVLKKEAHRYNFQQIHSTTGEIPFIRFNRALEEKKSLFREFSVPPPFESTKDIFCLRAERVVNPYRKISFNNLQFQLKGVAIRNTVQLRIVPNLETGIAEIRVWNENNLAGVFKAKNEDLKLVHF